MLVLSRCPLDGCPLGASNLNISQCHKGPTRSKIHRKTSKTFSEQVGMTHLVSRCSATVRHCSCYTRCSATPFYDIDMANLRCYTPPKRTEAAATVPFLRPFQGCSATVVRHCENTRPKMLHKCSATAVARHPWCSVWATKMTQQNKGSEANHAWKLTRKFGQTLVAKVLSHNCNTSLSALWYLLAPGMKERKIRVICLEGQRSSCKWRNRCLSSPVAAAILLFESDFDPPILDFFLAKKKQKEQDFPAEPSTSLEMKGKRIQKSKTILGSVLGRTIFCGFLCFAAGFFFAGFWVAGFFLLIFLGTKCPEKSSRKILAKTIQNLCNKNPRHISAERLEQGKSLNECQKASSHKQQGVEKRVRVAPKWP